ncbi:hypothetical protein [Roseovarius sp.]|uniref:hypothetical protein n=1 Tax=Roseovarius sp. TaxID=1486281 RepID=UPI000C463A49|nr:hypothetical protein [Roseovarius sp.]MAZ19819.1 hypothetical protein [Roseovarius sp.]
MSKPVKPVVPPPALRSEPDTFKDRAEANIEFFEPLVEYMDDVADFVDEQADAAVAAAQAGDLPPIAAKAGQLLKVNAGGTGLEFQPFQSSATDTTPGRPLVPGSFGVGESEAAPYISDLDALDGVGSGFYQVANFSTEGLPSGIDYASAIVGWRNAGNPQVLLVSNFGKLAWRGSSSGAYGPWRVAISETDKASQPEAEAGADNTKWMTPLRAKQAIDKNRPPMVNFDGVTTVSINNSREVSSVVRDSAGTYTITFASAMPNADYGVLLSVTSADSNRTVVVQADGSGDPVLKTTTQLRIRTGRANPDGAALDAKGISVVVIP